MSMYEHDLRALLAWKIAKYSALARAAGDDQTTRAVQALVRELELQLRAEQPDARECRGPTAVSNCPEDLE
jgi:hypothetical protein